MYGLDIDKDRVEFVLKNIEWYKDHGYNPVLPNGQRINDLEDKSDQDLMFLVEQEYSEQIYAQIAKDIEQEWENAMTIWDIKSLNDTTLSFSPLYCIKLTKYGTSGSYQGDDTIILNIKGLNKETVSKVIFHEIIHLTIESLIQKYEVTHWHKERLVDLIFKRVFPEKAFEQKLPEQAYEVDSVFESNYGNIEKIIVELSSLSKAA